MLQFVSLLWTVLKLITKIICSQYYISVCPYVGLLQELFVMSLYLSSVVRSQVFDGAFGHIGNYKFARSNFNFSIRQEPVPVSRSNSTAGHKQQENELDCSMPVPVFKFDALESNLAKDAIPASYKAAQRVHQQVSGQVPPVSSLS